MELLEDVLGHGGTLPLLLTDAWRSQVTQRTAANTGAVMAAGREDISFRRWLDLWLRQLLQRCPPGTRQSPTPAGDHSHFTHRAPRAQARCSSCWS